MKALTIRHPWPWAICHWGKDIENRTWFPTRSQLREGEKLAIHAGKMVPRLELEEAFDGMYEMEVIDDNVAIPSVAELRSQESSIVAVATYAGAVVESPSKWFTGSYGWTWAKLVVLPEPVPCRGAQGLWNVPADVLERMRLQFKGGVAT